ADLVGAAVGQAGADLQAVAAPGVVGLPGGVRRLEQQVGGALVGADDEVGGAGSAGVVARQPGEVQAAGGGRRDGPGGGHGPVAGVDQPGGGVGQGVGLVLLEDLGGRDGGDQAGAVALVVAQPVDVDVVGGQRRVVDLERDGLAVVDADVGGEALD